MKEAKFYKNIDNKIQCQLCNHYCIIKDNKVGICKVRKNKNGKLITLIYGYPVAQNIDPVEKKPLYHFMPGSFTYSLGTLGCNFFCTNCQNWDISQAKLIEENISKMDYCSPEKIVEEALGNDCKSISYTYNEPTIFTEYALDIMKLAKENGLKNVWVSNGFMSTECLEKITPYLDAINVDLKSMDDDFYRQNCGARLNPVLENLKKIKDEQIHLEITTLIIPEMSDNLNMIEKISNFIADELDCDTPWHISKFSPEISWKLKNKNQTSDDLIYKAYEIGKESGLKYVYVGNMPGDSKENTYCPKCKELVIRRMSNEVDRLDNKGLCPGCDTNLDIYK